MQKDIPDRYRKPVLVIGCGNILFGDDGFGPEVVEYLEKNYNIPEYVEVINAGTSIRNLLFDIALAQDRPEKIIIVDALDVRKKPGDIFKIEVEDIPENKIDDFSMHQLPTSNLLRELKNHCGVDIRVFSCQVENIPESISKGLSKRLIDAVPKICNMIVEEMTKKS
jgi:coenzyme F420 hydrogenase subunit delta